MAYATADDLASRWRPLSETESKRAEVLLEDASVFLDSMLENAGIEKEGKERALQIVSCNIVKRIMATTIDGDYSSVSRTAGSFNEQYAPRATNGNMYLNAADKKLLGLTDGGHVALVYPC